VFTVAIKNIRARYKLQVQSQILGAARELFVHEGYRAFSLRALARRIGYSPAAIYKHFKSKQQIFDLLAQQSFQALTASSSGAKIIPGEEPVARLKRGMLAYIDFGLRNPDHYRFAFLLHRPAARPKPQAAYESLRGRVQDCIATGKFHRDDAELMVQSLWAAAHGITSLLIQKPAFPWVARKKLIRQVVDSAVAGLLVPEKKRSRSRGAHASRRRRTQIRASHK
jgi:AcrR family transcriptional regulator